MRKSNILVVAILVVASLLFLWLWNYFHFNLIDPVDLIITIVWWVVIIGVCVAIVIAEKKRRERLRTIFVSDEGFLVNGGTGVVRLEAGDPQAYVNGMRQVLNNLDYDTDNKINSSTSRLRFNYVVHSDRFSNNGNVWEGNVIKLTSPREQRSFDNARELTRILASGL